MTNTPCFSPATFDFLRDLAAHNERTWFQTNRQRWEREVRDPAVRFITDFGPHLAKISKRFRADPRPVGGSLFRIHRDTRFSKDKRPYKTHTGIQFRHDVGKDAHAPGYYLHLEPGTVFVGIGIWHPDAPTARKIRDAIAEKPAAWRRARDDAAFATRFTLEGESLKRPPAGYAKDHPLIVDLKRKDFIAACTLTEDDVAAAGFLDDFTDICRDGTPLVRFLCRALEVPF
ncbi:MAG: DUF2461 domain-containing protein [Longimicrobiales bacterium]